MYNAVKQVHARFHREVTFADLRNGYDWMALLTLDYTGAVKPVPTSVCTICEARS